MERAALKRVRAIVERANAGAVYSILRPRSFLTADRAEAAIGDTVFFRFCGRDGRTGKWRIGEGIVAGIRRKRNNAFGELLVEVVRASTRRSERPASEFYADRGRLERLAYVDSRCRKCGLAGALAGTAFHGRPASRCTVCSGLFDRFGEELPETARPEARPR